MGMRTRIKLGIDYHLAENSHRGMGEYTRKIVYELVRMNEFEIVLFVGKITKNDNFESCREACKKRKIPYLNQVLYEQIFLPIYAAREEIDILWCPNNTFPLFLNAKIKLFVTIHDLMFFSKSFSSIYLRQKIGKLYRKFVVKMGIKKVDTVLTVSEYSKQIIKKILHHDSVVVKNQISIVSREEDNSILEELGIKKGNYFYTISGTAGNKNLLNVIRAYKKANVNVPLVITGVTEKGYINKFSEDNIKFTGYISEGKKNSLLKYCKAFLFLSVEEGFGIPILESFFYEVPVLASNKSPMKDIVGNGGLLVDPLSVSSIINGIYEMAKLNGNPYYKFQREQLRRYCSWSEETRKIVKLLLEKV